MLEIGTTFPYDLLLDDPETGERATVKLRIKRLDEGEFTLFDAGMKRLNQPPSLRLLGGRAESEQEKNDKGEFIVSEAEVITRRIKELTPEKRAAYDKADADDNAFVEKFARDSISRFVTVVPSELKVDGEAVITGAGFYSAFFARKDVLSTVLFAVLYENSMSAIQKKVLRSLSDLTHFSSESALAQAGLKLAEAAASAKSSDSAENGPVTASIAAPSGSAETATSSSTRARSRRSPTKRGTL